MGVSRSENMRRIRSKDTRPELQVRKLLRELGYSGYRLHRKDLPGRPDVAYIGRRKAIFVHGCFWHGHDCKEGIRRPKTNRGYWGPKIEKNQQRDFSNLEKLHSLGWSTIIIWECEMKEKEKVANKILMFLEK